MIDKGGVFYERSEKLPPARFVSLAKEDKAKSLEEGRPIFVDKPYIEILKEGGNILQFPASDKYKERYPKEWEAFQSNEQLATDGMPLEQWAGCTRSQCENLKNLNVFSVEQLADASEAVLEKLIGSRVLKEKAKAYLEQAQDSGKMVERLTKLEETIEYLKIENEDLKSQLKKNYSKKKKT